MHLKPAEGTPRPVGRAIVDHLFGEGENGRIPDRRRHRLAAHRALSRALVAWLLHLAGQARRPGLPRRLFRGPAPGRSGATAPTGTRRTAPADQPQRRGRRVREQRRRHPARRPGLRPLPRRRGDRHGRRRTLGELRHPDVEQMPRVLRTQVDVVLPDGCAVLNADEARCAGAGRLCDGEVVLYSLRRQAHRALTAHRGRGRPRRGAASIDDWLLAMAPPNAAAYDLPRPRQHQRWRRRSCWRPLAACGAGHRARADRRRTRNLRSSRDALASRTASPD